MALKEGKTIELMNFFHFKGSDMVLRHVTLTGISRASKIGELLPEIWTLDVKANQLADVISGIAPVRLVVNLGVGIADLVLLPMEEMKKKDGRESRDPERHELKAEAILGASTVNHPLRGETIDHHLPPNPAAPSSNPSLHHHLEQAMQMYEKYKLDVQLFAPESPAASLAIAPQLSHTFLVSSHPHLQLSLTNSNFFFPPTHPSWKKVALAPIFSAAMPAAPVSLCSRRKKLTRH
ncbi:hypothetical protein PtB15_17B164 [Puccinia triticina]|nr:hypothetical protein PtB15_17B164 [Puccinia triticina]